LRIRNVAVAFESTQSAADGPEVLLNASVTEFAFDPAGNLSGCAISSTFFVCGQIFGGRLHRLRSSSVSVAGSRLGLRQ
jgi:hypothetical protein